LYKEQKSVRIKEYLRSPQVESVVKAQLPATRTHYK